MSRFLAPIHFWLFNKIKYHEELEKELINAFEKVYGDEIKEIEAKNIEKYGERLPDESLENIIDTNNIHGWLQGKINVAETRQAAILADLFGKYQDSGIDLAKSVYEENGKKLGEDAKSKYDLTTPKDIYNALNNYLLNGMPCDNVEAVDVIDENYMKYSQSKCLHIEYWKTAGVDPATMYDLRAIWTSAFVSSANPDFVYQVTMEKTGEENRFMHKIFKK